MTDQSFPPIQISSTVNGDHWVFRANDGEELEAKLSGLLEQFDGVTKNLAELKKLYVAKGVFTGDSNASAPNSNPKRSKDSPPPSAGGGEAPHCKHGPMNDLSHMNFKKRWYCPERGQDRECWAKN